MSEPSAAAEPEAVSYGRRITDLARERPHDEAAVFAPRQGDEQSFTWAELEKRSTQAAQLLRDRGVARGAMVVVGLPNCPEHLFATLGAWKLGGCVLPLRWDLPAWERERLIEVAQPRVIVADWDGAGLSRADIAASAAGRADPLPDCVPEPARAMASSGSTGRPKIIVAAGRGEDVPGVQQGPVERAPGRVRSELVPAPLYHTNGFVLAHRALFGGDRLVLMERFDAAQVVHLIERHQINVVTMVPTMLLRIARLPSVEKHDFSSLDAVWQGGASCPPWLVRAWLELVGAEHFFMSYGSTENVGLTMIRGDEWLAHPGSVGLGRDTEIRILDESGREVPPGEVGEIFMRRTDGEGRTFYYVGAADPQRTADGFTSIGDLGWLDADGYLYIADRRVDMVVTGGANVFPAEVEAALLEHLDVADAVVIGLPDEQWGQRVHALIQPRDPAQPPTVDALREHCRERLAAYKVPKSIEIVADLPRSDAGKLSRSALIDERTRSAD